MDIDKVKETLNQAKQQLLEVDESICDIRLNFKELQKREREMLIEADSNVEQALSTISGVLYLLDSVLYNKGEWL